MYFVSKRKHHDLGGFATQVGTVFAVGAAISLSSILLEPPWSHLTFYGGIVFDMAALVLLNRRLHVVPAHTPHLVERVGLLTIIMLGESVISISAALADIAWNQSNVIAAVSGFVMVSAIWWIYYDSFHLLEQRRFTTGHSILYSHFFLFVGLAILASLIRHGILGDLDPGDFRQLAVAGTVLFFLGKQDRLLHGGPRAAALPGVQHRRRVRPDGTRAGVAARARGHAGGHHGDDDLLCAAQPALPPPGARRAGADLSRCLRSTTGMRRCGRTGAIAPDGPGREVQRVEPVESPASGRSLVAIAASRLHHGRHSPSAARPPFASFDRRAQPYRALELLQSFVIRPAIAVKANLRAAGREHTPFVFVRLLRRHALELVGIERDALACRHVDANRPRRLVEPGIADRHEKPVRPLVPRAASPGHDEIQRLIFAAVDDDALQAGRSADLADRGSRSSRTAGTPTDRDRPLARGRAADRLCDPSPTRTPADSVPARLLRRFMMIAPCADIAGISAVKTPRTRVCEACVPTGSRWVHLRTCQMCGVTLCCDSSPNRHASRHAQSSGHPVVASAEPGEQCLYCYTDEVFADY